MIVYGGKKIETDPEGFLINRDDWSPDLMEKMAKDDGLELTEAHRLIISTVRSYFEQYATTPPMRGLIALLKKQGHGDLASSVVLARLFPKGAAKSAARYAGLPKPAKCI